MTNHVHLVVETPDTNLSRFMQSLETGYTVYYNRRHRSAGHVLQGRYGAKLVDGDEYLLKLSRYVHLNPVHVEGIKSQPLKEKMAYLRQYVWSSYPGYIGEKKRLEYVHYGPILGQTGVKKRRQQRAYRQYIEKELVETDDEFLEVMNASRRSIGGEGFRSWIDEVYGELLKNSGHPEDVEFRRQVRRLGAEEILKIVGKTLGVEPSAFLSRRRDSSLRPIAATMLVKYGGMTQRKAAKELGIGSAGALGRGIGKLNGLVAEDRQVAKRVAEIEADLDRKTLALTAG